MRNLHIPGRSNILASTGMAATSQPLSTLEAISILKKGVLIKEKIIVATTIRFFQMYRYIDYGLLQM